MIRARITRDLENGATHFLDIGTLVEFTGEGMDFGDGPRPEVVTVRDVDGEPLHQFVTEYDYRLIL